MLPLLTRFAFALVLVGSAVGLCPVAASDDVDAVKSKLLRAKSEYDTELQKFNKAIADSFDKREDTARKSGNKKALDEVKAQRKAFENTGELPPTVPAVLITQLKAAGLKLDKAHTAAVKELVKLKEDAAAAAVEKEQERLFVEITALLGKKTYLAALKHYDVKVMNGWFANNGTITDQKIKKDGELVPHSIFMHPSEKSTAQVKYSLGGKYLAFRASVGVPTVADTINPPVDAVTFEVLGDGKSLWKSEPVAKLDTFQTCAVRVEKVKVLTLIVHCPGKDEAARTVWFEPLLIE